MLKIKMELEKYFTKIRKEFPTLHQKINNKNLIYFDNGATSQNPTFVIESINKYYRKDNSNVHRGVHTLSERATTSFEEVRKKAAKYFNSNVNEIIFTYGATHSLNQIAFGLIEYIKKGDEIIISKMEHHANIVPWQEICKKTGAKLKYINLTKEGRLDLKHYESILSKKTKIVSICHVSNVLGTINPIKKISKLAKKYNAIVCVDGAQAVPHFKVNFKELDCDYYALSAHKMYSSGGVGLLIGKREKLELLKPIFYGGSMIYEVNLQNSTYADLPNRLEAGTPNISDVIAFGKAIEYCDRIDMKKVEKWDIEITKYLLEKLKEVNDLEIYGPNNYKNRISVFSINIKGVHSHDLSSILDKEGIAIRAGHHCAMPLMKELKVSSTGRISLCFYNTKKEIGQLIKVLKKVKEKYEKGEFLI